MNKFKWGGVDQPGVYVDENVMRMCKSYRVALFSKLAAALMSEGKNDKALDVDKAMAVLPPENVPLDYSALSIGEFYYELGQKERRARPSSPVFLAPRRAHRQLDLPPQAGSVCLCRGRPGA